ncbi:MAG: hypothetical protein Q7S53_00070 [bacterium]|nr:hypothetical protein [bacterium]
MELENNQEKNDPSLNKSFLRKYWWLGLILIVVVIVIVLAWLAIAKKTGENRSLRQKDNVVDSPASIPTIPATSASAITSPPSNMEGINTHTERYSNTGADQNLITLGPKVDNYSTSTPYSGKRGFEFELDSKTPLLAPMDMTLTGFQNNSTAYGIGADGQKHTPMNDLMLSFESNSPDWPGVVIVLYHLYTSPLVPRHYQNSNCGDVEVGTKNPQAEGHLYFPYNDNVTDAMGNAEACQALIGYKVKRGELIGYAGNVGEHSFASFCFKVPDKSINPTVKKGNRNLHWVQPASFFYWKSYSPDANFPSGVLAYPFEADGYQLPAEQRDANFKYTSEK